MLITNPQFFPPNDIYNPLTYKDLETTIGTPYNPYNVCQIPVYENTYDNFYEDCDILGRYGVKVNTPVSEICITKLVEDKENKNNFFTLGILSHNITLLNKLKENINKINNEFINKQIEEEDTNTNNNNKVVYVCKYNTYKDAEPATWTLVRKNIKWFYSIDLNWIKKIVKKFEKDKETLRKVIAKEIKGKKIPEYYYKIILNTVYTNYEIIKILKQKKFFSKQQVVNEKTWTMFPMEVNKTKEFKDKYIKNKMLWKETEHYCMELGLVPIFLTNTLDSSYHPFEGNAPKETRKLREDFDFAKVAEGVKVLQKFFTSVRNQFSAEKGYAPIFLKAIEPHKTGVPHQHILMWVGKDEVERLTQIIQNKVKLFGLGNFKLEILDKDLEHKSPLNYLLKYMQKNSESLEDEKELYNFLGWQKVLGIKTLYSNSNLKILPSKWSLKILTKFVNKDFAKAKGYRSVIEYINSRVDIVDREMDAEGVVDLDYKNCVINPEYTLYRNYFYIYDAKGRKYKKVINIQLEDVKKTKMIYDTKDYKLVKDAELNKYQTPLKDEIVDSISVLDIATEEEKEKLFGNSFLVGSNIFRNYDYIIVDKEMWLEKFEMESIILLEYPEYRKKIRKKIKEEIDRISKIFEVESEFEWEDVGIKENNNKKEKNKEIDLIIQTTLQTSTTLQNNQKEKPKEKAKYFSITI